MPQSAAFVPKSGDLVWFQRPDLVDTTDEVSRNRQRSLVINFGIGPFTVHLVERKKVGHVDAGIVVTIIVPSGMREVPVSRLVPEQPTALKNGCRVAWVQPQELGAEAARALAGYKKLYGPGPFTVDNAVPAYPFGPGSDLITIRPNGEDVCLPEKFFTLA